MPETDETALGALLVATQQGDAAAYATFLAAVTPLLRRFAGSKLSGSAADLEDFVQDTLLSLHQARATYQPGRPLPPWLYAIARNRLADQLRRRYRRGAVESVYDAVVAEAVATVEKEPGTDLSPLLARLPEGQRRAIEMVKLQEMSLQEASMQSGVSVGALKVAVHRGIAAMRQMIMGKDMQDDG